MDAIGQHPYTPFISRVKKPAQYLGGEHGQKRRVWTGPTAKVCLAFPDLYEVGMSHLGFRILYGILNDREDTLAERCYAPWPDLEAELRRHNEPLRSLENWKPLCEFDVVGFSLQFELTYTNVLTMLDLGGIALRASDRSDDAPLVLAGGPVATHAEPLAPFVDAFVIGDGEEVTPQIARRWKELSEAGTPRLERLKQLTRIQGVYVPSLYETELEVDTGIEVVARPTQGDAPFPVKRAFVADLSEYPFPAQSPTGTTETVFDRSAIEIARGCTEGCRFCQAGMIYRPVRERRPVEVIDTVKRALDHGGYDEASLTCLSTADYSAVTPLIKGLVDVLKEERVSLSVASLRAYGLSEDTLDDLREARAGGLTFAPEAGTQRMRDVINKNVTEAQLLETAERVFSRGWDKMKLYFMIGLPTEEDEDVRGIVETGKAAQSVGKQHIGGRAKVVVSVSTHVPKPHTPFQWCAMDSHAEVVRKQDLLRQSARGSSVRLRMHDAEGSWLEGVIARGDRRVGDVIETAYKNGARFDSWQEHMKLDVWEAAFEEHGLDTTPFLGTLPVDARLPWDHIDVGLEEGFLKKEYRKAMRGRLSPPCGKMVGQFVHATHLEQAEAEAKRLVCYNCGVACDLDQMRQERKDFLVSLDAIKPRVRNDIPSKPAADRGARTRRNRKPPPRYDQGPAKRIRLSFSRLGAVCYAGHLDLIRLLPRIFRRAGVPLFYTEGFNPRPAMTFSPALPVGMHALGEYLDVKVDAERYRHETATLPELLNAHSLEGIRFFDARDLGPSDPALNKVLNRAQYVAAVPWELMRARGLTSVTDIEEQFAKSAEGPMEVVRIIKGIKKKVRVGDYLQTSEVGRGADALARAGIIGDILPIRFVIEVTGQGTARPSEALEALLGTPLEVQWVRERLFLQEGRRQADPIAAVGAAGHAVSPA